MDEIASIKEEAQKLRDEGVKIIIAVGHSGFNKDKEIAKQVSLVDVVVGGNNHILFICSRFPKISVAILFVSHFAL